jgi:hypothetical protein
MARSAKGKVEIRRTDGRRPATLRRCWRKAIAAAATRSATRPARTSPTRSSCWRCSAPRRRVDRHHALRGRPTRPRAVDLGHRRPPPARQVLLGVRPAKYSENRAFDRQTPATARCNVSLFQSVMREIRYLAEQPNFTADQRICGALSAEKQWNSCGSGKRAAMRRSGGKVAAIHREGASRWRPRFCLLPEPQLRRRLGLGPEGADDLAGAIYPQSGPYDRQIDPGLSIGCQSVTAMFHDPIRQIASRKPSLKAAPPAPCSALSASAAKPLARMRR